MNLNSGYPLDLVRNGIPYDYPRLMENRTADVVVLGGGISGALISYSLAAAGIEVLVMDGRTIGLGSTCANTSILQYEIDKPLYQLSAQIGKPKAERCYHLSAEAIDTLTEICSKTGFKALEKCNSVYFAAVRKDVNWLQKEYAARASAGFDVRWTEGNELENTYGLNAPAAIVSTRAAQTNAYLLTHHLHQHNINRGVEVFDRTPAVKISHSRSGVTLTTAEGHRIRCKKLVYATGYESVKYIDKKIVRLSATYATASEQMDTASLAGINQTVFWNTANPYFYMRLSSDNRVVAGGRDEHFFTDRKRDELIETKAKRLGRDVMHFFPAVPFKKEFSWTGVFGSTKDGLPYVGAYNKLPNGLFALGFGGNGINFSIMAARIITDAVTGHRNPDEALFGFNRL